MEGEVGGEREGRERSGERSTRTDLWVVHAGPEEKGAHLVDYSSFASPNEP